MKKVIAIIFIPLICFAVWFTTSLTLGGQAKQWFENEEPQIEQEQPSEKPENLGGLGGFLWDIFDGE